MIKIKSTTVCAVLKDGKVTIGADGQATMGNTVAKSNVNKIRVLLDGKILAGFAGSTADAFTLIERFEEKLSKYGGNMKRSAIELAKDWRMDRYLRRLEAMMIVADNKQILIVSGTGDVIEPDNNIATIGSGSMYAQAAATALKENNPKLTSEEIVKKSLKIAADIGATHTINSKVSDFAEEVKLITNNDLDVFVDNTGLPRIIEKGYSLVNNSGRRPFFCLGLLNLTPKGVSISPSSDLVVKHKFLSIIILGYIDLKSKTQTQSYNPGSTVCTYPPSI